MTRELICIECPRGCEMTAVVVGDQVTSVAGNFCVRGRRYAESECVNPVRVLTTTIRLANGEMLPVKTDRAIEKARQFAIMERINVVTASVPIVIGQILADNIDGRGANLIATKTCVEKNLDET